MCYIATSVDFYIKDFTCQIKEVEIPSLIHITLKENKQKGTTGESPAEVYNDEGTGASL